MAKIALLIGVSDYKGELASLPGTQADLAAMQRVLQHPKIGGFDTVDVLSNPDRGQMEIAIERLLTENRSRDDLIVLYFSGHGINADDGTLYFATCTTTTNAQGRILTSTAVPASALQQYMSGSRSKRQVLILDCCFSGAFANDMRAKQAEVAIDVKTQLGGEGRVVLTSSTATQMSYEQDGASIYTRYLVQGLETGAADRNNDGQISIDELHEYAKEKVQEAAPTMQPEIYAIREGYKILIARAPQGDPALVYRKEFDERAKQKRGKLSPIDHRALRFRSQALGLSAEVAEAIAREVLQPYEEFWQKLHEFEQAVKDTLEDGSQLSAASINDLRYFQQVLSLRDEDISSILNTYQLDLGVSENIASTTSEETSLQWPSDHSSETPNSTSTPQATTTANQTSTQRETEIATVSSQQPTPPINTPLSQADSYNKAPAIQTDDYQAWNSRGLALFQLGRYEEAIASYDQALAIKPDDYQAWNTRGVALFNLGRNEEAIASYDQALAIKADYHYPWNNRGLVLKQLGRYEEAIASYDQAVAVKADYHEAWNGRGNALFGLGRYEEAIASYDQALAIKVDDYDVWHNRGLALVRLGLFDEAIASYERALAIKADYYEAWSSRGNALGNLGRDEEAIASFDQALSIKADYYHAWYNRGVALERLRRYEEAINNYDKTIAIKVDYYQAWYNRGVALFRLGRHEEAIASYDKALALKADYHEAWNGRGFALFKLECCEEAIVSYDQSLAIKANYLAWNNRGLALDKLGHYEEAIASYDQALALKSDFYDAWYNRELAMDKLKAQ